MNRTRWRQKPTKRLWLLTSLLLATATLASDDIVELTTTEPPDIDVLYNNISTETDFISNFHTTTEYLDTVPYYQLTDRTSLVPSLVTTLYDLQHEDEPVIPPLVFQFTRTLYNASIPESSSEKTYVMPSERMGIITNGWDIRYKIIDQKQDNRGQFEVEHRLVGDFCFIMIRTRSKNVLNRERKDRYELKIKATAIGERLEADTTVVINILDVNDLKPLFYPTSYEVTVPEDTPLHKSVLKVTAEDADLGRNGEIYYSFSQPTELFSIHPMTGVISLTRPLRFQESSVNELVVIGQDRGATGRGMSHGQASSAKVKIRVSEVNLHVPEIYVKTLPKVVENIQSEIYAVIRVVDQDKGVHGEVKSLDIVDGDPDGHFRIKPVSGKKGEYYIQVLRYLDRETTPHGYNLTLKAVDNGVPPRQTFKSVPVLITDINDNAPVFDREIYEIDIQETAPINTPVIRLKVTDADEGKNAQVFLEIVGGNEGSEFKINPESGMLYTAKMLDAEYKSFYTLTVSAIDQGNSGVRKQSSAKVKINIIDTNDNDPIFEKSEVSVVIDENEPAGTTVTKVTAKDKDSGENAYISYSIANLSPVPFEIDHFSGVIRTTQVIDFESMKRQFVLRVRASDWGMPYRRQTEMQVKIRVRDVNDNRPQFEKIDCTGHVSRNVNIGAEILTLSAIDFDAGNIISYRIVSGNEDNCFNLDSTTGVLTVTCDLMDVRVDNRILNVTATDGTHFADVAKAEMNLVNTKRTPSYTYLLSDELGAFKCRDTGVARRLTEVLAAAEKNNMPNRNQEEFAMMPSRYGENLHSPEYINFPLEIKVNESVPLGTSLGKILARDRDLGYNGKLVFGISSGDQDSVFRIDPDTGELKVIGYLDRERVDQYFLNISVFDLGKPQKSTSKLLPVTILDVNDNAPKFEKSLASFRVTENANNGTAIFRVNATDADLGANAKVTYSLVTDTQDFSVDPTQGVLYVSSVLDRERQDLYELKIRATDGGSDIDRPALYSDAIVRIYIDDINDNAPAFALPNYTVKVREDIPVGSVIAIVSASDPDIGQSGEVRYYLSGGSDIDGYFIIDKLTGTIRTAKQLDFEERQVHSLIVRARDRGTPSLSSETIVRVEIVDVNENLHSPVFNDFVIRSSVGENVPVGSHVTTVKAVDDDPPGDDSRISYFIKGGDGIGLFSIDDEGHITTLVNLDIESKKHYWLTVVAEDHGVVPLHSFTEVYIAIENENDNTPLTEEPVYFASIRENSGPGKIVLQVTATDADIDPKCKISFRITAGNAPSYFTIDSDTGVITTTSRKLDRETQTEHILEITVSDNGTPQLSSTTRVIITVTDENDNAPSFDKLYDKVTIPATTHLNQPLFQVLAVDNDVGPNAELQYSIKSGHGKGKFKMHPKTGVVYAQKNFIPGQYDLMVLARDSGNPPRNNTTRLSITALPVNQKSTHPPKIRNPNQQVQVTENDSVRFFVAHIEATDEDGDFLWYNIVDGDKREEFYIGRDTGNILIAKQLDWETQHHYNVTVSVTDGVHTVYTQVYIMVIDSNDNRPQFSRSWYKVDISENVEVGTQVLKLQANDADEDDKIFYSLHTARSPTSLDIFSVDSISGSIMLKKKLDRETISEHLLTVMVKDQGTPSKRNFARVLVRVHDHNDHAPEFTSPIIQGKVYETCEIGTTVAKIIAIDKDRGENARVSYSIVSGNVGNVFTIDQTLGDIQVTRQLDINTVSEYNLNVRATDHGDTQLSSTIPVHIMVTMADNAPPRFMKKELAAEIYENQPLGTYVTHVEARTTSSLFYEIVNGNTDDMFFINPSTGVVLTKNNLDYEKNKFYNLTIEATNMAGSKARCSVIVHVLDRNDNPPQFLQASYTGFISESAVIGSLVLTVGNTPLVIKAQDADSELNALLNYDIVENFSRRFFHIDSSTGAIRTVMNLDHESIPRFNFHVKVSDLGKPKLSSETIAKVEIKIIDVNDCPPVFGQKEFNSTVLLPTYQGVAVIQLNATDKDSAEKTILRYDIVEGNVGNAFNLDQKTGLLMVEQVESLKPFHKIHVRVSDGMYSTMTYVNVRTLQSENSGLLFQKTMYFGSILENSTKITTVCVVNVLGTALNEHIKFSILNPTDMFSIGATSGAVRTTGKKFDREIQDKYELIIEARSDELFESTRVAHVIINVTILDINDNCPMFVNLPYYAVVSIDAKKGDGITKVHAVDMDKGENGEVRYELIRGNGELFKVCRKTGEITLKQNLEGHNREYELVIAAYDGGITPCSTEVPVHIKIIDKSMPVFDKQFYTDTVLESVELHSPLSINIQAESPLGRKLIYSIVRGNEYEEFALDFNTAPDNINGPCVIYIVDELDYETKRQYDVTIRATDSVSGVFAEVLVSILIQDVNDSPPEFSEDSYNISVSEAEPFGTSVLKVIATDNDTGINQKIRYEIKNDTSDSLEYFYIDPEEGTIFLKKSLDHEKHDSHHFTVVAVDSGVPSLSSTAHVWVTVLDMNDNPPNFEAPSYSCLLSERASRGQFVMILTASDPDYVDQDKLYYTIVGGNEQQIFSIEPSTGIITLTNLQNFAEVPQYLLNVSVSDSVYTSFSRVKIDILPANRNNPTFEQHQIEVKVKENQLRGTNVTKVQATDQDFGKYGELSYSIQSELLRESFEINRNTGDILTRKKLDRETKKLFEIPVTAADSGGRLGFLTVRVKVEDENDNEPIFQLKEYKTTISSNLTQNSVFLKVKANDADEGINAELQYSIVETEGSDFTTLFGINPQSGGIFLLKNSVPFENKVFQFFVRASDSGIPVRYSDVPVEIYIMGQKDVAPMFERRDDNFFLPENSPPGTLITKLKLVTNTTVRLRVVSPGGADGEPMFAVDHHGQLTVAKPLDRELTDTHIIGIIAETDSTPPLTALTEVMLKVLDDNDNAPQFESSPYRVFVAENIEEGSSILKVNAHDRDLGNNGEVRYSLAQDSGDLANIFAVDSFTGWIKTLVPLDKETIPDYSFQIIVTDNGHNKHFARTSVYVKVKDYNDNPPVFTSSHYKATVNEDALPGTVVVQLMTTDADVDIKSRVEFYITSGDKRSQFQIRQTGEVFVAKPLDREQVANYELLVVVTDGVYIATTKVTIGILDANDNPPYCLRHRYRNILSEGVHPGTYVLTVLATDIDEDENLRYYLTGDGSDKFLLDGNKGHLKTTLPLDREEQSRYQLTAHVQDRDRPEWECSSQIEILISDLNDNPPQFSMDKYSATLAEDVQIGTLVTKLHATDPDIGINRKIRYSLVDSAKDHFRITSDSGIITLQKPLDREQKAMYNLTVKATDQGTPQLSKITTLLVLVLDINDNPPEFVSKYYYVTLPENVGVGTDVTVVLATSKDTGVNAEVSYSIVGGNEHKKFGIHSKTGVISVIEQLDYERAKDYYLTIQAVDGGVPPLSNHATVNISVTDSNDNAPVFVTTSYSATIREDADIGGKILQVQANDLDSGMNGKISYAISKGDRDKQFTIDPETGYMSVNGELDRETTSSYVLEIRATDHGEPPLSSYIHVNLDISDFNDNPPLFSQANYTAIIQEDKPIGYTILKFQVTDADTIPNTFPYTFDFRSGNEGSVFTMAQDGVLQTAAKLNHRSREHYVLHIRVFDNGSPPLSSDTFVAIKVIEESQYPPVITPLEVSINSFLDQFPGGVVGKVHASDLDQYDTLSFSISSSQQGSKTNDLFDINKTDGTLTAKPVLDVGEHYINVTVTDGKYVTNTLVKINVELISDEMLDNAIIVRFRNVSPLDFVRSHRKGFTRAVRSALSVRNKDITIISVQNSDGRKRSIRQHTRTNDKTKSTTEEKKTKKKQAKHDSKKDGGDGKGRDTRQLKPGELLDVLFAVRKTQSGSSFYTSDTIRAALTSHLDELEQSTGLIVEEIVRDRCSNTYCVFGVCRDKFILETEDGVAIATDVSSFLAPKHQHSIECACKEGYKGERCEEIANKCAGSPCPSYKICLPDSSSLGYSCLCKEGYTGGTCEKHVSECHDSTCYTVRNPISFSGKSYVQYNINKTLVKKVLHDEMNLSLRVRTVQQTANLMYAAGRVDYSLLEIVNGVVQYRFDLGSGEGFVRVSSVFISDGEWHKITLERNGNSAKIEVDEKYVAQGSSPGISDILNVQANDVYLAAEVHSHATVIGYEDLRNGFIGCMDDVKFSGVAVPLHMSGASPVAILKKFFNVEFKCEPAVSLLPLGPCGSQPCLNGGTCTEYEDGYQCQCVTRFQGINCEIDTNPCESSPCLYGGICSSQAPNEYTCDCLARLSGKRCQYGRYCSPNPCRNGGLCEEGETGPICKCRGFTGELCSLDLDECRLNPCMNGATCYNSHGSYRCQCSESYTGFHCGTSIYSSPISSSIYSLTLEELVGIIVVLCLILFLVTMFILFRKFRMKRTRQQANHINNDTRKDIILNSNCKPSENDFKRGSKLSNLEISQRDATPHCPPRPASYTPSSTDPVQVLPTYNNLDTLRSYGSAGDELESELPPDYLRNLNRTNQINTNPSSDSDSLCKPWNGNIPLVSFSENNIKNDLKLGNTKLLEAPNRFLIAKPQTKANIYQAEDDQQRYHWDCSDWARQDQRPLPNITEVPGSEVPDSSSFHSNESNESNTHHGILPPVHGPIDPARDIETLNEDQESEYVGDSGTEFNYSDGPHMNALDSGGEDYRFLPTDSFLKHPNTYLPKYNIQSDDGGGRNEDSDEEYDVGYGFPKRSERSALLGSHCNLSSSICDIDESELDAPELKILNPKEWKSGSVQQTAV